MAVTNTEGYYVTATILASKITCFDAFLVRFLPKTLYMLMALYRLSPENHGRLEIGAGTLEMNLDPDLGPMLYNFLCLYLHIYLIS